MEIGETITAILNYGGTIIMAGLFLWVFITDKTRNNKLLEESNKMTSALVESNKNIAKSLDIISSNQVTLGDKADRNYQELLKKS